VFVLFSNLPAVSLVTINIYREVDRRKKKDSHIFIGLHSTFSRVN
jgi:hypothetical protein